jgi:DNA-binding FrmR family transcriptional regulator
VNNRDPWVYKTTDFGKTWRLITTGLAKTPLSYAHVVREDPVRRGLLYLGTEGGLYVSFNDGGSWQPLQNNMPRAPVYWIVVQPHFSDLVVATYGRGFWILDDITPLRTLGAAVTAKEAHLFQPRVAYRLHDTEQPFAVGYDASAGFNAPYGAPINFYLKTGSDSTVRDSAGKTIVSKDSVSITIADASGAIVRTLKAPRNAGINRVWWNLRGDLTKQAKIRTSPEYAPWFSVSLDGRDAPTVGRLGVLMPPGAYTVKIAGTSESQPLVLRKDPNTADATEAALAENVAAVRGIAADLDSAVTMINALENVRGQLAALKSTMSSDSTRKDVMTAADSLDMKLRVVERKLFQTRATGRGQDILRWPQRISEQLQYLAGEMESSDYTPTESQRQVAELLRAQVKAVRTEFDRVMAGDVAAFNAMLQQRKVPNVISN